MGLSRAPPFLRREVRALSKDVPDTWVKALCLALAGGSRYAFAGGNPISNIEFNGHDWLPTLAGIGGALAVAGVCLAIGVATAGVGAVVCAVVAGLAATLLTNATPATTAQAAPATTATSSETITPPRTIPG